MVFEDYEAKAEFYDTVRTETPRTAMFGHLLIRAERNVADSSASWRSMVME